MAKLVKLTTTIDKNRDTNGYLALCNDDILIEPNSKVSLLNAHISSGVLASYDINGIDSLGQTPIGQIMGNIQLGANDRTRDVILANGNDYSIDSLLGEITAQMNSSLVHNSTTTKTTSQSATLDIPPTLDFGLETGMTTDPQTNQVTLNYNSAIQKYTKDFKYTNLNSGVTVSGAGLVQYSNLPPGYFQITLDRTQATRTEVFTTTDPGTGLAPFDVVNLCSTAGGIKNELSVIRQIQSLGTNVDNPFDIDVAKTDVVKNIIYQDTPSTTILPYQIGQDVTMDDGAGVPGTPSANTTTGKIKDVGLTLKTTDNYSVEELEAEFLTEPSFDNIITAGTIVPIGNPNEYKLTVESPFASAASNHYLVDSAFYILGATDNIVAVCQIKAVAANADAAKMDLDIVATPLDANPIDPALFVALRTGEFWSSDGGKTDLINTQIKYQGELGLFDTNDNLISSVRLVDTTLFSDYYVFELEPNTWQIIDPNTNTLVQGYDAFVALVKNYIYPASANWDFTNHYITYVDRVITVAPFDPAQFLIAAGTAIKLFDYPGMATVFDNQVTGAAGSYINAAAEEFTIIPIDSGKPWNELNDLFKILVKNPLTLSTDNDLVRYIELQNLGGTLPLTNAYPTRLWIGTNIQETFKITLDVPSARVIDLTYYDTMVKGKDNVDRQSSLAVEDTRLSHSCGRLAFTIVKADLCAFGLIPETANFVNQIINTAYLTVRIENSTGGSGVKVYKLYQNGIDRNNIVSLHEVQALDGDTVIIQYGVTPSRNDYEYNNQVNSRSNRGTVANNIATYTNISSGDNYDIDRNKILVTIIRALGTSKYIHLGCVIPLDQFNINNPIHERAAKTIPWTPRNDPYREPIYFDNSLNLRMYVAPNLAQIVPQELTPSSQLIKDANGVITQLHATAVFHDPAQHETDNLEVGMNRLGAFNSSFTFTFTNLDIQKILGYKSYTKTLTGSTGFWQADLSYLKAYLPEGLVILLDNISRLPSYDCGNINGGQRQILCTSIGGQDKIGEISVEPNNLYRIALNNKDVLNLRKFSLSFEDLFGKRLILQNARVSVTLLFE
jgi:hypothetical protein